MKIQVGFLALGVALIAQSVWADQIGRVECKTVRSFSSGETYVVPSSSGTVKLTVKDRLGTADRIARKFGLKDPNNAPYVTAIEVDVPSSACQQLPSSQLTHCEAENMNIRFLDLSGKNTALELPSIQINFNLTRETSSTQSVSGTYSSDIFQALISLGDKDHYETMTVDFQPQECAVK